MADKKKQDNADAKLYAPKTELEKIEAHKAKMSDAANDDENKTALDLTTDEGYLAYPHKLANVTRGDLLLAMQGGSGKGGIETLAAKWDLADHGDTFANEDHLPLADRQSQGKATQVQGARAPEHRGDAATNSPGSVPIKDIGKSKDAHGREEHRS